MNWRSNMESTLVFCLHFCEWTQATPYYWCYGLLVEWIYWLMAFCIVFVGECWTYFLVYRKLHWVYFHSLFRVLCLKCTNILCVVSILNWIHFFFLAGTSEKTYSWVSLAKQTYTIYRPIGICSQVKMYWIIVQWRSVTFIIYYDDF